MVATASELHKSTGRSSSLLRMKGAASLEHQARMGTIKQFVHQRNGQHAIQRVLIANNGIAAVKEIRSVRKWCYDAFGDDRAVEFVAMATPEDMSANAEYIKMADFVVKVPGGPNNNNYANVDLIVSLAVENKVQAVWAGWGHASENPRLPDRLSRCNPPICFIGPRSASMRALGDKISSTIIAQSLGVSVVPWSGSGIHMDPEECFDEAKCAPVYERAYVKSVEDVKHKASLIGYPLMIKASEGGGGKGIRKVHKDADLRLAFEQVQREVPGSPVFLMKLAESCRHLEIQVVADQHGNVTTLFGRDCSVQRRHQKIIEEAPISVVDRSVSLQMEADAIKLAKSVRYESVGTVEYLYDLEAQKYYFLELNPRLQVEHPTTEMVSRVNIPALQLQVAMGIPLHRIDDVRRLYRQDPAGSAAFAFDPAERLNPAGHVIATRITAENPDAGFKPNGGRLHELNFKGSPSIWGYFSIGSYGSLHEYADSQFGHMFAHGEDRDSARRNMIVALKELCIRGEFRTTVEYLIELLEKEEFAGNTISTSWLDRLIAEKSKTYRMDRRIAVISGSAAIASARFAANEQNVVSSLRLRGIPNPTLLASDLDLEFIYENRLYACKVFKTAPSQLLIKFNTEERAYVACAGMADGGFLLNIDGKSHVMYFKMEGDNYRITVDGKTCILESELDPSTIKSPSPGKLVRYLVEDGSHVTPGTPVAEIEVMKMFIPLLSTESGSISFVKPAGTSIDTGDLIATLVLDNPEEKSSVEPYAGRELGYTTAQRERLSFTSFDQPLLNVLNGHVVPDFKSLVASFFARFTDSSDVIRCFSECLATLTGRIESDVEKRIQSVLTSGKAHPELFADLVQVIREGLTEPSPLLDLTSQVFVDNVPNLMAFRRRVLIRVIEAYWKVERAFHGDVTAESLYTNLAEFFKSEQEIAACFRSHYNLQYKNGVFTLFLETLLKNPDWAHELVQDAGVENALRQLTIFSGPKYFAVVHASRDLLLQSRSISPVVLYQQMELKLLNAFRTGEAPELLDDMVLGRFASMDALPKFFTHQRDDVRYWALEAYVRRVFQSYDIVEMGRLDAPSCRNALYWHYTAQKTNAAPAPENSSDPDLGEEARLGFIGVADSGFQTGSDLLSKMLERFGSDEMDRKKALYFVLPESIGTDVEDDQLVEQLQAFMLHSKDLLEAWSVRRVTFAVNRPHLISMNAYTFRSSMAFKEDSNIRHVEPALAYLLELKRITDNHDVSLRYADSEGQAHIYHATEKQQSATGPVQKMFVRLLIRPNQMMRNHRTMLEFFPVARTILEQMFESLESVMAKEPWIPRVRDQFVASNHLFINIIAVFFHTGEEVAKVLEHLMVYYDERFTRLGIRSAEVLMNLVEGESGSTVDLRKSREYISKCQRVRFFFENHLGLVNATEMHAYRESRCNGKLKLDCFYGQPKHDGSDAFASHSACSDVEIRRNRVLKLGSTYIYDFPRLFEHVLTEIWQEEKGVGGSPVLGKRIAFRQMTLGKSGKELVIADEPEAARIGMVAWLVQYDSPEYPEGRSFVLMGNDLDFEIGAFGTREDELFFLATEYARKNGIPRVYISANSGAKLGLATELLDRVKIEWKDEDDHAKGFDFLYLEDADLEDPTFCQDSIRLKRASTKRGCSVHQITAIIGEQDGLGVENLSGSGLIAGVTSRAYQDIFTLTYVTGRAVGIGAYLVRLGQRAIQRRDAPIILTGSNALNGILGREVYLSNLQIGGPQIMAQNGISHRVVDSDFAGVREIFRWLSYVPAKAAGWVHEMAVPRCLAADPVERPVNVTMDAIVEDPRALLVGANGQLGFLDQSSFTEYWETWAKSVIVGRGKLGGISVGVICTESRATESVIPSDPGRLNGASNVLDPIRRAGQVWFPDSAWKTAAALKDFRTERLPVLIFANWRGFSGGPGDLFDGILQFGSMIVDELVAAELPVFVYLPAGAELRGGSWVVLDSTLNEHGLIEMYADPSARAGVMEPEGIVAIKFRKRELARLTGRLELKPLPETNEEDDLSRVYHQIAVRFADLHDTSERMLAKQAIRAVVPVSESRSYFYTRLLRRLLEEAWIPRHDPSKRHAILTRVLPEVFGVVQGCGDDVDGYAAAADSLVVRFFRTHGPAIKAHIASHLRSEHILQLKAELARYESEL